MIVGGHFLLQIIKRTWRSEGFSSWISFFFSSDLSISSFLCISFYFMSLPALIYPSLIFSFCTFCLFPITFAFLFHFLFSAVTFRLPIQSPSLLRPFTPTFLPCLWATLLSTSTSPLPSFIYGNMLMGQTQVKIEKNASYTGVKTEIEIEKIMAWEGGSVKVHTQLITSCHLS